MTKWNLNELGVTRADGSVTIPWSELRGLHKPLFSSQLEIRARRQRYRLDGSTEEVRNFILQLFTTWKRYDADAAKKNAFDYVDTGKSFAKLQLLVSFVFCLGFAYVLYSDSLGQLRCSQQLHQDAVPATAQIVKAKKKRDGHYILDLSFATASGQTVTGQDQLIIAEKAPAPEKTVPVVYSQSKPTCWALADANNPSLADFAKRRFFSAYLFLFGVFFGVSGVIGTVRAIAKLREKRPFINEVTELFQFNL